MSVSLSARICAAPTGLISVYDYVWGFYENSRENPGKLKVVQKYLSLYIRTEVRFNVVDDIDSPQNTAVHH
jgi:hypothetical protein